MGGIMKITLNQYISKKLDGVEGEIPRLIYMFKKSFTRANFRMFWNVWNPIYSYILTFYVYKPMRKVFAKTIAFILTFTVSGLFHDVIVYLMLGYTNFSATKLFITYALILLLEDQLKVNLSKNKLLRIIYNFSLLMMPFLLFI